MKKWDIFGQVRAGKFIGTVEAETKKEAVEKGWELEECHISICHQCSRHIEDPEVVELVAEEEA